MSGMYLGPTGPGFYISTDDMTPSDSKGVLTVIIVLLIICSVGVILWNAPLTPDDHYGEYQCTNCGSRETTCTFNLYWDNNGMLCNGSEEYNRKNAYFVFGDCEYCGKYFKIYRSQWKD
jgi:hypothetical protein